MNEDITIIVNSCDSYSDLWEPFFTLLKKYWMDCQYPIVLNTEHKNFHFDGLKINVINLPDNESHKRVQYGQRLKNVLTQIDSEYVLILLDDFFIRNEVKTDIIEECRLWMDSDKDIAYISFESFDDILNSKDDQHPNFVQRPTFGEYKINLQAGLWRRRHLLKHLRNHESPWDFELLGNIRTFKSRLKYYALDPKSERVIDYRMNDGVFPYKWSVVGGKWVVDTVENLFRDNGINVDFSKRGIYTTEDFAKDAISTVRYTTKQLIRSIGLPLYFKIYKWGYVRRIYQLFQRRLPSSYIEYKRGLITNN